MLDRKVALHNLGCKVNQYETDAMGEKLKNAGYTIVDFEEPSDVYIINTCTVTNMADRKSRQMLHKAKKLNPEAVVVAAGCYVQVAEQELEKDQAIDIIVGNNQKENIVEIINDYFENKARSIAVEDISKPCQYEGLTLTTKSMDHTRVFLKIQDGCNQFCSYCIIPYSRGRIRSKDINVVKLEAEEIGRQGVKEIVLTGIHLSSYGKNYTDKGVVETGYNLIDAIKALASVENIERIRLGSLEPGIISREFLERTVLIEKLCPHFHLSLQSGCDTVLKRMNRRYTTEEYFEKCCLIREYYPKAAITTDIIVGFPEETDEEFETTMAYVDKIKFAQVHVFKYSMRKGTVAAKNKNQIDDNIKGVRSDRLIELETKLRKKYIEGFLDEPLQILTEEVETIMGQSYMCGYTKEYVRVAIPVVDNECLKENEIIKVKPVKLLNDEVILGML